MSPLLIHRDQRRVQQLGQVRAHGLLRDAGDGRQFGCRERPVRHQRGENVRARRIAQ